MITVVQTRGVRFRALLGPLEYAPERENDRGDTRLDPYPCKLGVRIHSSLMGECGKSVTSLEPTHMIYIITKQTLIHNLEKI